MLKSRSGLEAVVLGEEIFALGGYSRQGDEYLSDTESYNPVTDEWKKRASMNTKRYGFGVNK